MTVIIDLIVNSIYLLAVINPLSKVALLAMGQQAEEAEAAAAYQVTDKVKIFPLILRSTIVGALLLYALIIFGEAILNQVFHVEIYSLRVAGGLVLSTVGFQALKTGMFFGHDNHSKFVDLAIVPLACPMIAGPASITASITLSIEIGIPITLIAVSIALALNLGIMAFSRPISALLSRYNVLGAFIRITGLVVMTIGVQMVFNGISGWMTAMGL
ncbi:MAG: MarC family protein [Spirochaetia bacterium]|nr:MarC family protein [Spirochaetia bacterium]